MGYIYKIYNDINDKFYIGKTLNSIEERFKQHCSDSKKQTVEKRPLYNAMNKYGVEHFFVEEVEECKDDILNERECYWINYFGTYDYGYNATKGGDGKCLYDHDKILERLKEHPYSSDITKEFGCCVDIVREIAKKNNIKLLSLQEFDENNPIKNKKTIMQYDKNNNFIQGFDSVADAAKWCFENNKCAALNSGVRSHIAEVANGKRKSAYNYIWKYE